MLFKNGDSLAYGNLNGFHVFWVFMRGISYPDLRVARLENVDLVELRTSRGSRVLRYAMHDCEVLFPVLEKADYLIDILQCDTRCGGDDRFPGLDDPFKKGPVSKRTACHLDNIEVVFFDQIDGFFVERSTDGHKTLCLHFIPEHFILIIAQAGFGEALYILEIQPAFVVRMYECIEPAVLQLESEVERKFLRYLAELPDYLEAMLRQSHVVIRHLKHEQGFQGIQFKHCFLPA